MDGGEHSTVCSGGDLQQRGLETFEVFVEGMRSRDRRFLPPKTGMLRALQVTVVWFDWVMDRFPLEAIRDILKNILKNSKVLEIDGSTR